MHARPIASLVTLFVAGALAAQEMPTPAKELQKYAPLIGTWRGSGRAQMGPGEPSKWESQSTYAWALGNFFVQEDTVVTFSDMPKPLVMRTYLGWDAENHRYVSAGIDNDGTAAVHRLEFLGDGSMVQQMINYHEGQTYFERYSSKIDGDKMSFAIDMMMPGGQSSRGVQGTMARSDKPAKVAMDASAFTATPAAMITRLGKTAGTYAVKATMVMMPGTPTMNIHGTDEVQNLFDGTIVHVHTTGTAEGMPGDYVGELFYGYDALRDCIRAVYVSNMGEVGEMDGTFGEDGKTFVLTAAMRYMGQPCASRMVMELGADGAPTKATGHCMLGAAPPFENWNATYTRK